MFAIKFITMQRYFARARSVGGMDGSCSGAELATLFHSRKIAENVAVDIADRWGLSTDDVRVVRVGCAMGNVLGA
jgi:hypothetical protein